MSDSSFPQSVIDGRFVVPQAGSPQQLQVVHIFGIAACSLLTLVATAIFCWCIGKQLNDRSESFLARDSMKTKETEVAPVGNPVLVVVRLGRSTCCNCPPN